MNSFFFNEKSSFYCSGKGKRAKLQNAGSLIFIPLNTITKLAIILSLDLQKLVTDVGVLGLCGPVWP